MQAAIPCGMRLTSLTSFALVAGLALFHATTAHADEGTEAPPAKHRSSAAYGGGVALTTVGSVFLAGGLVCGIGGLVFAGQDQGDTGAGVVLALLGGMIWAGATVVGVSTLVPGIVLMVKNAPSAPREPVYHDAKSDPPAPRFTSVPILSATF